MGSSGSAPMTFTMGFASRRRALRSYGKCNSARLCFLRRQKVLFHECTRDSSTTVRCLPGLN